MTIFLLLIFFFSYIINILIKKKIIFLSLKLNEESSNLHKILSDTNRFIREIILNNYLHIFERNFYITSSNIFNSEGKISFLSTLPRYLLEAIFMIIGALLILLFSTNKDFLFNMGFIFFLFLRLFPYLNIINTGISNVRGSIGYINFMTTLFNNFTTNQILLSKEHSETFKKKFFSLKIDNLNFSYKKNFTLKKINFQIKNNQILAITGASGSGKTTLLNIVCGFLEPEKAHIIYNDIKIESLKDYFWQNKIAYVSQSIPVFDESLIYNITLDENFNFEKNKDKFNEVLDLALIDWITKDDQLYIKVGEDGRKLSGGQKQRLALARALYLENKEILILDEITSALDFANEKILVNKFKLLKNKYTIISVTHRKAILEIADNILNLD
jgi:ABC-type multidrug transport system fused ATPase/permease subunit